MAVKITQLISYPIKSCAGIKHQSVVLNEMGLAHDRQFMLVDQSGLFLSQRKFPQMALIQPSINQQLLKLTAPGMNELTVDISSSQEQTKVSIWQDTLQADLYHPEANQWFSNYLNEPVSLVKYGTKSHRPIEATFNPNNQQVAFADGFPLLVTHQASLNQLNSKLSEPVGMERFRPNIVVSSELNAWDEFNWQHLINKDFTVSLVKPSTRCVMTGIDQHTGLQTGSEILKTLKQEYSHQLKAVFGINGIVEIKSDKTVQLRLGQKLELNSGQETVQDQLS